jgi:MarR family transcriptional regulator, transcriptional regulator for hemolysin
MDKGGNAMAGESGASPPRRTLGFLMRECSRLMRRRFVQRAREAGLPLNRSEAGVLVQVSHEPGINLVGIAAVMDLETISVVRLVDGMEAAQLVERRPHPTDRRVRTLWLTAKWEAAVAQVLAINAQVRSEALAGIADSEREHLLDLLGAMRTNLAGAGRPENSEAA